MVDLKKKIKDLFLIGGLISSSRVMGKMRVYKMILRIALRYKRTLLYLLKKFSIKDVLNFLYVKLFIPTGEGAGGFFYLILPPLIRRLPFLVSYPRCLGLEITTACNLKCNMCEHSYWKEQEERHLNFEEFKYILSQFPELICINPTGEGSAFLNPDYIKMLRYLKSKHIFVYFIDNFINIDEDLGRELIKMGVDGIYVSIDAAHKETYEKIRIGGDFEKVRINLKRLLEIKKMLNSPLPEICSRYTIQKFNIQEMPDFVEFIASFGNRDDFGDGARIDFCGILDFKEIDHLAQERLPQSIIIDTIKRSKEKDMEILFQHIGTKDECNPNPSIDFCLCWVEPFIMMGGYVLPCCSVVMSNQRNILRKRAFGNVFKNSFKQIWNSERYKRFRSFCNNSSKPVPAFCAGCRVFETKERIKKYGIDYDL